MESPKEGAPSLDPYRIGPGMSIDERLADSFNQPRKGLVGLRATFLPLVIAVLGPGPKFRSAVRTLSPDRSDKVEGIPNLPEMQNLSVKTADRRLTG